MRLLLEKNPVGPDQHGEQKPSRERYGACNCLYYPTEKIYGLTNGLVVKQNGI